MPQTTGLPFNLSNPMPGVNTFYMGGGDTRVMKPDLPGPLKGQSFKGMTWDPFVDVSYHEAVTLGHPWEYQIRRNDALANYFLQQYMAGALPPGEQEAIDLAYKSGSAALGQAFANMGITGPSTTRAQGQGLLAQEKAIMTGEALMKEFQQYMGVSGLEAQLTAGYAQSLLQHEANQVALIGEWLQFELGQESLQQQKDQMMGSLLGSIGSLFGGLFG